MTRPDDQNPSVSETRDEPAKPLSPAARRALAEAAERRAAAERDGATARPPEVDGPPGPEPTRYGDWEKGGIASDF